MSNKSSKQGRTASGRRLKSMPEMLAASKLKAIVDAVPAKRENKLLGALLKRAERTS